MNRPETTYKDHMVTVTSAQSNEVAKQMTWIAKGVAGIAHQNPQIKHEIYNLIEITDGYEETNENLDLSLNTLLTYDYDQEVNNWLLSNVPGNDYNQAYFFDIDIDDCPGKVTISIPNADVVDTTSLHVVTHSFYADDVNSVMGYFINSSGNLDSLLVDENNASNFYLYVVGLATDCDSEGFCGDGICQPWLLEDYTNCEDCKDKAYLRKYKTEPRFQLKLKTLHLKTDEKNGGNHPNVAYQEHWLENRYEVRVPFGLVDKVKNRIYDWNFLEAQVEPEYDENGVPTGANVTYLSGPIFLKDYKARGRKSQIKINRKDLSSGYNNKGPIWNDNVDKILSNDYFPKSMDLLFGLAEFDAMAATLGSSGQRAFGVRGSSKNWSYIPNQNIGKSSYITGGADYSDQLLVISSASTFGGPGYTGPWQLVSTTGPDIFEAYFPLDGEMSVTLQIIMQ